MGRIVILILFLFSKILTGQSIEDSSKINKGFEYYNQLNYEEAYNSLKDFSENEFFQKLDTNSYYYNYVYGVTLKNLKKSSDSETYLKKALKVAESIFGEDSYEVYNTSIHLLSVYYDLTKIKEGETLINKQFYLNEIFSDKIVDRISFLNEKIKFQLLKGDLNSLPKEYENLLLLQKQLSGEDSLPYLTLKSNLVTTYTAVGEFDLAFQIQNEIISKLEQNYPFSFELIIGYYNLANQQLNFGQISEAEESVLKSIELQNKTNEKDALQEALSYRLLGRIYQSKNLYTKSLEALIIAKNILETTHSEGNLNYADILFSLAYSYQYLNENKKVLDLLNEVLNQYDLNLFQKIEVYSYIANIYFQENKYEEALNYFHKAENLAKSEYDKTRIYSFLSLIYTKLNEEKNAKHFYKKSIELINKLPNEESKLFVLLNGFKFLTKYYSEEELIEITNLISENLFKKELKNATSFSSNEMDVTEAHYFWLADLPLIFRNFTVVINPTLNKNIFQYNALIKNLSLKSQNRIRQTILEKGTPEVKEKYQDYLEQKSRLAQLETQPLENNERIYNQLKEINENLEKELIRLSSEFADAQKEMQVDWLELRNNLKPGEAIVDLVSFNLYSKDKWTDSIQYAAFIVKPDSKFPEFVPLFEEKQLKSILELKKADSIYESEDLYRLFIQPLEKQLKGVNRIFFSPNGLAHQIDFSAIQLLDGKRVLDNFKINLIGATTQIKNHNEQKLLSETQLVLYGDIDYDKATDESPSENLNEKEVTNFREMVSRSGIGVWGYLPGTREEIESISHLAENRKFKTLIKNGTEATKESLQALSGKKEPFVLHLATHGFFFENAEKQLPDNSLDYINRSYSQFIRQSENPMLRSGLVFSGANKTWNKDSETDSGQGILTASEIAALDLTQCELVVLSACDTGLGDINGSEGVFGLQRAFKLAGAKNVIMSLWKVPDEQTSELFRYFYEDLLAGKTIHKAFVSAQNKMKEKYSPYYWAGFVLLE